MSFYSPHPLSRPTVRKQTPRKVVWRTRAEAFDPSRVTHAA